jgi:hypothetical protein
MKRMLTLMVLFMLPATVAGASDPSLVGVWNVVTYELEGKDVPMDGLFIFTEKHFSANAFFHVSGGELDDMNANAGTYRTEGDKLIFMQQVQAHIRPGDEKEPISYGKGVEEAARYAVEDRKLIITFPSGNRYISERLDSP